MALLLAAAGGCGGSPAGSASSPSRTTGRPPDVATKPSEPRRATLAGGHLSTCFFRDPARVICWGVLVSPAGPPSAEQVAPFVLAGVSNPRRIAGGLGYLCVDSDDQVRCTVDDPSLPFRSIDLGGKVSALDASSDRACAIVDGGNVKCWIAVGGATPESIAGISGATDVAVGIAFACALRNDGKVLCWGDNEAAQLGDGTHTSRQEAREVQGLGDVVQISTRKLHTCALKRDGTVWCWGLGDDGQLGDGVPRKTDGTSTTPVAVRGLHDVSAIAAGNAHTCALSKGHVFCWGANGVGQLGDGTLDRRDAPVEVSGLSDVIEIAAGGGHQCAAKSDHSVWCWGNGAMGQTGQGLAPHTVRPARVKLP